MLLLRASFLLLAVCCVQAEPEISNEPFDVHPDKGRSLEGNDLVRALLETLTGRKQSSGLVEEDNFQSMKSRGAGEPEIAIEPDGDYADLVKKGKLSARSVFHGLPMEKRTGEPTMVWPGGQIPYVIDRSVEPLLMANIQAAIAHIQSKTCVRWVPRTTARNYVLIRRGNTGCHAVIGYQAMGAQELVLSAGCESTGIIVHEMLHCMGFHHEQNRGDRDAYVTIVWDNMERDPMLRSQFNKAPNAVVFYQPYDYDSIMHYKATDGSANGRPTIITPNNRPIGQRIQLSPIDIMKINIMYSCPMLCQDHAASCAQTSTPQTCLSIYYQKVACPVSCRVCPPCVDTRPDCVMAANPMSCGGNPVVRANCPFSCGACPLVG